MKKGILIYDSSTNRFDIRLYPLDTEASLPTGAEIERIIEKMRICAGNAHIGGSDDLRELGSRG